MVISYVMIFFAATGGLLGLAFETQEQSWRISALVLYLLMAIPAFVQRAITGM